MPGTADVETAPEWYLWLPPLRRDRRDWDTSAPFSRWTKIKAFRTQKDCRAGTQDAVEAYRLGRSVAPTPEYEGVLRCIAADDPRLKEKR